MRQPSNNKKTLDYGSTSYPYSSSNPHSGTDYSARPTPAIYAPERMVVSFVGEQGSCGKSINAAGAGGRAYRFCHLAKYEVVKGQVVREGERIGTMGATGFAFGKHLHFVMWVYKRRIDGYKYISKRSEEMITSTLLKDMARKIAYRDPFKYEEKWVGNKTVKEVWQTYKNSSGAKRARERYNLYPGLEAKLEAVEKELSELKNKPPEVVIKEVEKIIEKPVEVVKEVEVEPSWLTAFVEYLKNKIRS